VNILFISHRIPYPPNKGDKIRSFHEIKYLSKMHTLYLAFLVDEAGDLAYVEELRRYCAGLDYDYINPLWQKIKAIPYLMTSKPLSLPYFYSKRLQNAVDKRLAENHIDAIICFSSPMAEYLFRSEVARLDENVRPKYIMDFVDVDSDKWRMYAGSCHFPRSAVYRREWKRLMEYERKIGEVFDWSIFVSEKEAELYEALCPESRCAVIPNGVDIDLYDINNHNRSNGHESPTILFIGAMDYFPNDDAVLYFSREVWPLVKKEMPLAKFYVIGGNPSKKVKTLSQKDKNIIVTGFVSDVRDYLKRADVFVAPLRVARGVQNKVLEAMAAGVPVVARPEAVQGLGNSNGCVKVAENNERFALSILKLIKVPHARHRMISDARRFIMENHHWEMNLSMWDNLLVKSSSRNN
jgi:sugar transferase (PEP-CTERM/EpsH1 system associated)